MLDKAVTGAGPDTDPYAIAERIAIQGYEREQEKAWKTTNGANSTTDPTTAGASDAAPHSGPNHPDQAGSS